MRIKLKYLVVVGVFIMHLSSAISQNLEPFAVPEGMTAERFTESPCYNTIGWEPYANPILLHHRYTECEKIYNEKWWTGFWQITGSILISGALVYMVYLSRKKNSTT